MKKIFTLIVLSVTIVSCYDDYIKDYDFNAVYFSYQNDVRSMVVGEGMKIQIGVALGGVMENKKDRTVNYILDNTLITSSVLAAMKSSTEAHIKDGVESVNSLLPLPGNYHNLNNSGTIVIKAGQHSGSVTVLVDSAAFLADAATIVSTYVLPFYITDADADSIIESKRYSVVGIKYENMLFGNYLHGGVTTVKDASGTTINTINYYTAVNQDATKAWKLKTVAPNAVASNGYSDVTTSKNEIILTLNGTSIMVSSAAGSTNTYQPDDVSTYNGAKLLQNRKILLNYKYVVGDNTYYCQDTLTFRNRIRDGVNEWQDENPSHYFK
jgi:hypothetical protein